MRSRNVAVVWHNFRTWITFAHEVGHNFGGARKSRVGPLLCLAGEHSFELGQGKTGGIMDYGNGQLCL